MSEQDIERELMNNRKWESMMYGSALRGETIDRMREALAHTTFKPPGEPASCVVYADQFPTPEAWQQWCEVMAALEARGKRGD